MTLRLFLDSADPSDWEAWLPSGLFFGITTNPRLLKKAGQPCDLDHLRQLSRRALELLPQELHLQAWGSSTADLVRRGTALHAIAPDQIVVKVPVTATGAAAAKQLISQAIPVTFTACYEPAQVLIAAALGARYIAPYLGRISDLGRDGHAELITMQRCLDGVGSGVRLLVASLRQASDLTRLAEAGMTTFTMGPAIAAGLFAIEATEAAAAQFEQDAIA
ncbi:transaldolase family protein [Synechococcus sp. CBW1107]|uniref:transaldolase family protein n=1 Tax=Synechococcus sp. CBW1107 TaxID=2789857 RepID=UPI002AD2F29E|nr:transaldolase family protein [Synechococcus sp. CBW1107]CAK6691334.1 Transaldolase [Synechococcus sp. CBW1107]